MATARRMGDGSSRLYEPNDPPERQFVKAFAAKKQAALLAGKEEREELQHRDFVLDIELDDVWPRVWRRVKVSGGMRLATFQDRVLNPAMG